MRPKTCIPLLIKKIDDLKVKFEVMKDKKFDMIEIRIDYFEEIFNEEKLLCFLKEVREIFTDKEVIFTLRTKEEGGNLEISEEGYKRINTLVLENSNIDFIDFEVSKNKDLLKKLIFFANSKKVKTILSYHNFERTPLKEELLEKIIRMEKLKGDINKLALMPNDMFDVLNLLKLSLEMKEYSKNPFVFISMGKLGMATRFLGEIFGSCITFGTLEDKNSIGQINIDDLEIILEAIHRNY